MIFSSRISPTTGLGKLGRDGKIKFNHPRITPDAIAPRSIFFSMLRNKGLTFNDRNDPVKNLAARLTRGFADDLECAALVVAAKIVHILGGNASSLLTFNMRQTSEKAFPAFCPQTPRRARGSFLGNSGNRERLTRATRGQRIVFGDGARRPLRHPRRAVPRSMRNAFVDCFYSNRLSRRHALAFSNSKRKPPIPAKRSINLKLTS